MQRWSAGKGNCRTPIGKRILVGCRKFRSSQKEVTLKRDGKRYRLEGMKGTYKDGRVCKGEVGYGVGGEGER